MPEKPGAQGVEQMPKSLDCRALADLKASELEEEEAYWNEYVDQMGPERCIRTGCWISWLNRCIRKVVEEKEK